MDWIWQVLSWDGEGPPLVDAATDVDTNTSTTTFSSRQVPPLHPRQKFLKMCQRVAANDASLKVLWLWDAFNIRDQYITLTDALSKNTQLERIHVQLGHDDARRPLGPSSSSCPAFIPLLCKQGLSSNLSSSLYSLSFSGTTLGGEQLCSLARCLDRSLSALRILDLSNCKIRDNVLVAWSRYLMTSVRDGDMACAANQLEELNLGSNYLTNGSTLANVLSSQFRGRRGAESTTCSLKVLKMARTDLRDEGVHEMLVTLANSSLLLALQDLDLSYNGTMAPGTTLRRVLASFPSLYRLTFDGNSKDFTWEPSRGRLQWNCDDADIVLPANLKILSLKYCQLHDTDVISISRVIAGNSTNQHEGSTSTLIQLHLSHNHITDCGLLALFNSNSSCLLTRELSLSHNSVRSGQGILALLREGNHSIFNLTKFDLTRNPLPHSELREIEFWIHLNCCGARHLLASNVPVSLVLWSMVVSRVAGQMDVLFYIFSHKPELCGRR